VRRVRVYEVLVEGARDGVQVAVRIIPYLVAILVAIAMLRASGTLDAVTRALGPFTSLVGLPADALPMALLRPLSGSGAYAILASIIQDPAIGPDSYTGYLVSTMQGSTETTFYVLAVYFGAIQVRRIRQQDGGEFARCLLRKNGTAKPALDQQGQPAAMVQV
jgi:spore maturation protein SpmB